MSAYLQTSKKGMSLLEVILAITLFSIIAPLLFGVFFFNVNLSANLSSQIKSKAIINDVKSFIRLSSYEDIYRLARQHSTLKIREIDEDEILSRKFIEFSDGKAVGFDEMLVSFQILETDETTNTLAIDNKECAFPLRCQVFKKHPKCRSSGKQQKPMLEEYSFLFVKNR